MKVNRLYYLDNVKVYLTLLVVAHHAGQPYGQTGGFWYFETEQTVNLGRFFSVNAAFFMSLFFLISAYFLPASLNRKGAIQYMKDRLIKLGIPLVVGFLIIMPMLLYAYYLNFRDYSHIDFFDYYTNIYLGFGGIPDNWTGPTFPDMQFGHLWFIEHLLLYSFLYCVFVSISKVLNIRFSLGMLTNLKVLLLISMVGTLTFLVRIWYPFDHWEGLLGFIQIEYAHSPQYISAFMFGILAFKNNWLEQIQNKIGLIWLLVGAVFVSLRYFTNLIPFEQGGINSESFIYSFVETFICFGVGIGLLYLFGKMANYSNKLLQILSSNSYSVYIFHVPILVIIQYAFETVPLDPFSKFLVVTILGISFSYLLSYFIRKWSVIRAVI